MQSRRSPYLSQRRPIWTTSTSRNRYKISHNLAFFIFLFMDGMRWSNIDKLQASHPAGSLHVLCPLPSPPRWRRRHLPGAWAWHLSPRPVSFVSARLTSSLAGLRMASMCRADCLSLCLCPPPPDASCALRVPRGTVSRWRSACLFVSKNINRHYDTDVAHMKVWPR